MKTVGWDDRDYNLWSLLRQIPSYGRLSSSSPDHRLVDLQDVLHCMVRQAEDRYERQQLHGTSSYGVVRPSTGEVKDAGTQRRSTTGGDT